jgi:hypothetical protein
VCCTAPVSAGTVKLTVGPYEPFATALIVLGFTEHVAEVESGLQVRVIVTGLFVLLYTSRNALPVPPLEGMVTVLLDNRSASGPRTSIGKTLDCEVA